MTRPPRPVAALLAVLILTTTAACEPQAQPTPGPQPTPPAALSPTPVSTPDETAMPTPPLETPDPATTPITTPAGQTATPTAGAGPISGWTLESTPFTADDSINATIVASSPGIAGQLIAVGGSLRDEEGVAAAWRSTDGASWQAVDLPDPLYAELQSVADGPAGLLAVGLSYAGEVVAPAAWRSRDGQAWERVSAAQLGEGEMRTIAGGPAGYIVLGVDAAPEPRTTIWTSDDGLSWSTPAPIGAVPVGSTVNGVVATPDGFLAYGSLPSQRAAVWLSVDGGAWEQLEVPGPPGGVIYDLVSGDGVMAAVGAAYDERERVLSWLSPNGREWELTSDDRLPGAMFAVAQAGGGFVAVGAEDVERFRFEAAAWASDDGRSWVRAAGSETFGQARLYELLMVDGRLLAIGERGLDEVAEELQPQVWSAR